MINEEIQNKVQEVNSKTNVVQLVKDAVSSTGVGTFTRITLDDHVSDQDLTDLSAEYTSEGHEVFSNANEILILKH